MCTTTLTYARACPAVLEGLAECCASSGRAAWFVPRTQDAFVSGIRTRPRTCATGRAARSGGTAHISPSPPGPRQLVRNELDLGQPPASNDGERERRADQLGDHEPLKVGRALDGLGPDGHDEVLRTETRALGRAPLGHVHHLDARGAAELAREARRQRTSAAGDAEIGTADASLRHQRPDHPARALVDGHGEAEADPGNGGVHTHDMAVPVGERAARVARVERRVGLDHVVDHTSASAGRQGAAERRDDPRGHGAREPVRVADRDHELTYTQGLGVPELRGDEPVPFRPEDGELGQVVAANDLELQLAAVGEPSAASARPSGDDVRRGEHEPVRGEDDRAPEPDGDEAAPHATHHAEARHGGRDALGDVDDEPRVCVQRLCLPLGDLGHPSVTSTLRSSVPRTSSSSSAAPGARLSSWS